MINHENETMKPKKCRHDCAECEMLFSPSPEFGPLEVNANRAPEPPIISNLDEYAEFMTWTIEEIKNFLRIYPGNIPASNALGELERQIKSKSILTRLAKKHSARIDGLTKVRRHPNRRWCPTKKSLK